jgi:hypothetical protein
LREVNENEAVRLIADRQGWTEFMKPFLESNIETSHEVLESADPVQEPTKIARAQGRIEGIKLALDYVKNRI